jgi:hypothetical protein
MANKVGLNKNQLNTLKSDQLKAIDVYRQLAADDEDFVKFLGVLASRLNKLLEELQNGSEGESK